MINTVYAIDIQDYPIAKVGSVATLVNLILPILVLGASLGLLIMLLYGAFTILTAAGEKERMAKARKIISFSILGIIIILASFLLIRLINTILNINSGLF